MNRNNQYPDINQNVKQLLSNIDSNIVSSKTKGKLQETLNQLIDLKTALDESSIVAATDQNGIINYVNDRFCEISKYSRDELLGQNHRIVNSGFHSEEFMRDLWDTILSGKIWKGEIRNKAKNGSYYWVNTTIIPFLNDANQPYQFLSIRTEITKLKQVEKELKNMMTKLMNVQEDERRKISRELHDGIGQRMFSLLIQIDRIANDIEHDGLEVIRNDVSNIIQDIRNMSWELRPSVLDDLGIVPAIRSYLKEYSQHYGIDVQLDTNIKKRLEIDIETTIYRVIQEALTNIGKYADVSEAFVKMIEDENGIVVSILDYGQGFVRQRDMKGVGLFSMEERARAVNGHLEIESEPEKGTHIKLNINKSEVDSHM
ncbi:PAS domain-containing sensor histidine kinase [Chengkuizengella axinellae]|uniref:histidine kinase n=1 Tax=Chengkuizengella axinellae TaxID=3064388 RepID=A0ABT9J3P2_9BACL|nr:PAS domain-containing protein [Chengkuizengella sp. 2205SS18-9]MDP5275610.1 PAS domain S-box protein [Chengkuizengella sp. 2205SS18-9]